MEIVFFRVVLICLAAISANFPTMAIAANPIQIENIPADLIVANRHIVTFRATIGSITPQTRVSDVQGRIQKLNESDLAQEITAKPITLNGKPGYTIELGKNHILGIVSDDLDSASDETLDDAKNRAVTELNAARMAYLELNTIELVFKKIGFMIISTMALVLVLYLLMRMHRKLRTLFTSAIQHKQIAKDLGISEFALRSGQNVLLVLHVSVILIIAYLWLTFELKQFSYTRPWADQLISWLLNLLLGFIQGITEAIPGLIAVLVIFLITRLTVRGLQNILTRIEHGLVKVPGVYPETVPATRSILTTLLWLFALSVAYPYLPGSDSDAFKGISLFAGLLVTLGSSGIASQWMSGIVLVYSRALQPGDMIRTGDNEGVVISLGLLSTQIRTATGELVTIPSSAIVSGSIRNFTRLGDGPGTQISTSVTIGYDAPWRQVHAMLLEAAKRTSGFCNEPSPFVLQRALNDFYVEYELIGRVDSPLDRPFIMSRLNGNVQDVFNEFGVQIMSPHFVAQPDQPVVLQKHQWFATPSSSDISSVSEQATGKDQK
jgi:small-conductance mechanosensitive channel